MKLFFICFKIYYMGIGDWGLGIGDWGLGIGPNPQSPLKKQLSKLININKRIFQ